MLILPKAYADEIIAHALEEDPNECCGVLSSKDGQVVKLTRITNAEHSPNGYSLEPEELLRVLRENDDNGWDLLAVYHSHTHTEAYPSDTDLSLATLPEARYILVSVMDKANPVLRAFRIIDGEITEEKLRVIRIGGIFGAEDSGDMAPP